MQTYVRIPLLDFAKIIIMKVREEKNSDSAVLLTSRSYHDGKNTANSISFGFFLCSSCNLNFNFFIAKSMVVRRKYYLYIFKDLKIFYTEFFFINQESDGSKGCLGRQSNQDLQGIKMSKL